jgi:ribosome-binding ATPase
VRICLIGLPGSGKSNVFRALTRGAPASTTSAGSFQVQTALVPIEDARLTALAELYNPRKLTPARVEIADVAAPADDEKRRRSLLGGELGNVVGSFDGLLHIVRCFDGELDAHAATAALDADLILSDLVKVDGRLEKLRAAMGRGKALPTYETDRQEQAALERLHPHLEAGRPVRELELAPAEEKLLRGFQLLSAKPLLVVLNLGDDTPVPAASSDSESLWIRGRLEADLAELDPADREEFLSEFGMEEPSGPRIMRRAFDILDRIHFFTVGEDEVRAWEVRGGATALDCAGAIHTDLAKGFIRAEVVPYDVLLAAGSMPAAKAQGAVRLEGKDKEIKDGEVLMIRFNV